MKSLDDTIFAFFKVNSEPGMETSEQLEKISESLRKISKKRSSSIEYFQKRRSVSVVGVSEREASRFCNALCLIDDTGIAITHPLDRMDDKMDPGERYLIVFGWMQAMYIQQDCLRTIEKVLGVEYVTTDRWQEVRDIRNLFTGHPSFANAYENAHSLMGRGETLRSISGVSSQEDGTHTAHSIDIVYLTRQHFAEVEVRLDAVANKIEKMERKHSEKYSKIQNTISWVFITDEVRRLVGTTSSSKDWESEGRYHLQSLSRDYGQVKLEMCRRADLTENDEIFEEVEHCFSRVRDISELVTREKNLDAYIFSERLEMLLLRLKTICDESDNDYSG